MKLDVGEGARARLKAERRASAVGVPNDGQWRQRFAMSVFLLVRLAVAMDRQDQVLRQGVHDRHADAVQAAGYLVGIVVKLTAGVQDGHDDLGGRAALLRVHIDRYAATVVTDRHGLIGVDRDGYDVTMTRQSFVDRVVDNLKNHVVETGAVIGVSDVHSRAFADRLQAL